MKFKSSYLLGVANTDSGPYKIECKFEAHTGQPFVTAINNCKCLLGLDDVPEQVGAWVRLNGSCHL